MYTHKLYLVDLVTVHFLYTHCQLLSTPHIDDHKKSGKQRYAYINTRVVIKVYLTHSRKKMAIMERKTVNFGVGGGGDESK